MARKLNMCVRVGIGGGGGGGGVWTYGRNRNKDHLKVKYRAIDVKNGDVMGIFHEKWNAVMNY